jgi:glycosyltransferase involved in cell wall biosynthesis
MSVPFYVFLPIPLTGRGVAYSCGSLADGMNGQDLKVTVVTPRARQHLVPSVDVVEVLPKWTRSLPYSCLRNLADRQIDSVFLSQIAGLRTQTAGAYIWPSPSPETIRKLRNYGVVVFREMINCHWGTAKRILDEAYDRLGAAPAHGITAQSIQVESEALEATDYIFACSPLVKASLVENGVPPGKVLEATNGWSPARVSGSSTLLSPSQGITAIFVGSICVRKGVHLLLRYWAESGVQGRLVLLGEIEPAIKDKCADLLKRNDVVILPWVREGELGALYRSADVFLLPTFEEGSPLVIYEACGCGLPVITTPMGAGSIVRHNCEGLVIDPYDSGGWIMAIRTLAGNVELRRKMGNAAAERAQSFVWKAVAARRREQILSSITAATTRSSVS